MWIKTNQKFSLKTESRCDGFMFLGMKLGGKMADLHKWKVVVVVNSLEAEVERRRIEGSPAPEQPKIEAAPYQCGHCKKWLPPSMFHLDRHINPPRQSWCRQCHAEGCFWKEKAPDDIFGKTHFAVLRSIRNPDIPEDFSGRNFVLAEIIEKDANKMKIIKSIAK